MNWVNHLRLTTRVNGTTMQDGNTSEFIFDVPEIIAWVSQFVTLVPGDIILTGTPSGVGCFRKPPVWLKHGDVVECSIEQLGTIRNVMVDVSKQGTSGEMNSSLAVSAVSAVEAIEKAGYTGAAPPSRVTACPSTTCLSRGLLRACPGGRCFAPRVTQAR